VCKAHGTCYMPWYSGSDIARGIESTHLWYVSVQTLHVVCGMCHGTDIARGIESTYLWYVSVQTLHVVCGACLFRHCTWYVVCAMVQTLHVV